jgi:hypothetical protein
MSQEVVNLAVPVGLNWNEQSAGSAVTVTGFLMPHAARVGGLGQRLEHREVGDAAIRQPARMIGLRPILSDSEPKKMKP